MKITDMELNRVGELFKLISDQGNIVISKFITYFGVSVGLGGGTVQAVAKSTRESVADNYVVEVVQSCAEVVSASSPDWLSYAPFIAATSLALKHIADTIFRHIEHKHRLKDSE